MADLPLNSNKWFKSLPDLIIALYNHEFKNTATAPLDKTLNDLLVTNFKIWGYEDEARRKDLPDKEIATLKRNIDRDNQRRNDLIDTIDAIFRENIEKNLKTIDKSLPLNSETPGSVFDRLTVLALRTYNLKKELERKDADKSHIKRCSLMLKEVGERSNDLLKCIEELLKDYYSGRKRLKSYKQHKLYNDPELNPSLRK
ncbi:MAG: DUF4254 domain-containing protein [Candidatus Omnitrophica bacterium]|nr:DUF4254 domain-containing protein [Candidatus Omnitrophota bacterium]